MLTGFPAHNNQLASPFNKPTCGVLSCLFACCRKHSVWFLFIHSCGCCPASPQATRQNHAVHPLAQGRATGIAQKHTPSLVRQLRSQEGSHSPLTSCWLLNQKCCAKLPPCPPPAADSCVGGNHLLLLHGLSCWLLPARTPVARCHLLQSDSQQHPPRSAAALPSHSAPHSCNTPACPHPLPGPSWALGSAKPFPPPAPLPSPGPWGLPGSPSRAPQWPAAAAARPWAWGAGPRASGWSLRAGGGQQGTGRRVSGQAHGGCGMAAARPAVALLLFPRGRGGCLASCCCPTWCQLEQQPVVACAVHGLALFAGRLAAPQLEALVHRLGAGQGVGHLCTDTRGGRGRGSRKMRRQEAGKHKEHARAAGA